MKKIIKGYWKLCFWTAIIGMSLILITKGIGLDKVFNPDPIETKYCYIRYNQKNLSVLGSKEKNAYKQILDYNYKIKNGDNPIIKNLNFSILTVPSNEKVDILKYYNKLSIAKIRFESNRKGMDSRSVGYVPIFTLHEDL